MLQFSDGDPCEINIKSTWKRSLRHRSVNHRIQTKELEFNEQGIQTITNAEIGCQIDIKVKTKTNQDGESKSEESKTDVGNNNSSTIQNLRSFDDEPFLERSVARLSRIILEELGHKTQFNSLASDEDSLYRLLVAIPRQNGSLEDEDALQVTDISWTATGSQLAVSFGRIDTYGWSMHRGAACLWNAFARSSEETNVTPTVRLSSPSGLLCIAAHPADPSVIAGGTYNGEVMLWNTTAQDSGEDTLLGMSPTASYCHEQPVVSLVWVPNTTSSGSSSKSKSSQEWMLVSMSQDGRLNIWDVGRKSKLQAPIRMCSVSNPKSKNKRDTITGQSLAYMGPDADLSFVVGSETGSLSRCKAGKLYRREDISSTVKLKWASTALYALGQMSRAERPSMVHAAERYAGKQGRQNVTVEDMYNAATDNLVKRIIKSEFVNQSGSIYAVAPSPFLRNTFLTASSGGMLRLFSLFEKMPLATLYPTNGYLYCCAWSPHRAVLCACGSSNGTVYVYDLAANQLNPVLTIHIGSEVSSLAFNHKVRGVLACGTIQGDVHIYKLGASLTDPRSSDLEVLEDWAYGKQKY